MKRLLGIASVCALIFALPLHAAEDVVFADFESNDYGTWQATGEAFGTGPARGTLAGQQQVSGFLGQGLVNTFLNGDGTTGALTSPPFKIEHPYINFLIGGGKHAGGTALNLLLDGKIVRTATGDAAEPLTWKSFSVQELIGKTAQLSIVDRHTGRWGHINVDQITFSNRAAAADLAREMVLEEDYLILPVKNGAAKRRLSLEIDGRAMRQFDIRLAKRKPDFWVYLDIRPFQGQTAVLRAESLAPGSQALQAIAQADDYPGRDQLYREMYRPQFHFTSRRGWLNDPNGLVYHGGRWHLFYQHNPYGWKWGNMHWGHAVSRDLLHWEEVGEALYPYADARGAVYSGSAVVDWANTSGFKTGEQDVLVLAFTDTEAGESLAYSNDGGRSFQVYAGNPVVKHKGRDPKIFWHEPTKRWIMAVYNMQDNAKRIAFHSSPDLKTWQFESAIDGYFECPDLFPLPIDGDPQRAKWVLYAADGRYTLGEFDGHTFQPEGKKRQLWYGNFYAAQTFSDAPDGRRIQIGWGRGITFPGMPFNQQMTVPVELTLRTTDDGVRMFAQPVRELASLRAARHAWTDLSIEPGENPLADLSGELWEVLAEVRVTESSSFEFKLRGVPVTYNAAKQELHLQNLRVPLAPRDGRLRLHLLVDRGSLEVFGNDGRVAISVGMLPSPEDKTLELSPREVPLEIESLEIYQLKSVWQ